jgi:hypothetical protein
VWDDKEDPPCLMRCWKVVGIDELWL